MQYYNTELSLKNAELLQELLYDLGVKFEKSACYNLIHFEILLEKNSMEYNKIVYFLDNMPYLNI